MNGFNFPNDGHNKQVTRCVIIIKGLLRKKKTETNHGQQQYIYIYIIRFLGPNVLLLFKVDKDF